MPRRTLVAVALAGCLLVNSFALAVEPLPMPLPLPKDAMPEPAPFLFPAYEKVSRYAVWELYGIDRRGGFRPRVMHAPEGAFYLYNGKPYPWTPMHQLDVMPYAVD